MVTTGNTRLGSFVLNGISSAPCGVPSVNVTFDIDANGVLNVTAKEDLTGAESGIVIESKRNEHTDEEVKKMIETAKKLKETDRKECERISERENLRAFCNFLDLRFNREANEDILHSDEFVNFQLLKNSTRDWLESSQKSAKSNFVKKFNSLYEVATKFENYASFSKHRHTYYMDRLSAREMISLGERSVQENDYEGAMKYFGCAYSVGEGNFRNENLAALLKLAEVLKKMAGPKNSIAYNVETLTKAANCYAKFFLNSWICSKGSDKLNVQVTTVQAVEDCHRLFCLALKDLPMEKRWGPLEKFVSHCDIFARDLPIEWMQMIQRLKEKQARLMFEAAVGFVEGKDFVPGMHLLKQLKKPLEEALAIPTLSQGLFDLQEEWRQYVTITEALQTLKKGRDSVDSVKACKDDKMSVEDRLNLCWSVLDGLKHNKNLVKSCLMNTWCAIQAFEADIHLEFFNDKVRARNLLKEVVEIALTGTIGSVNSEDWFMKATATLQRLQKENQDKEDAKPPQKSECLKGLEAEQKLLEQHKGDTDEAFVAFLFDRFPPIHRENYKSLKPKPRPGINWKKEYQKLLFLYHPDKVDVGQHGMKHHVLCEEITKALSSRYQGIKGF